MSYLDLIHRRANQPKAFESRQLNGTVFGHELPAWVIFHAMLGYVLIGLGFAAVILRIPYSPLRVKRWLHHYFGYTYLWGIVWMPITAIWCVLDGPFGWDVVAFFIFSMYAAAEAGWICIRVYLSRSAAALNTSQTRFESQTKYSKTLRAIHGIMMIYSLIMLLGAGISFPFRATEYGDAK